MREIVRDARGTNLQVTLPALGTVSVRVNLPGLHQAENARLALATLQLLAQKGWPLSPEQIERGFEHAVWPGRLEWIRENILLDGAHNPEGARSLRAYLEENCLGRRIVLLTGMMRDKQPEICAEILAPLVSEVVATQVTDVDAVHA